MKPTTNIFCGHHLYWHLSISDKNVANLGKFSFLLEFYQITLLFFLTCFVVDGKFYALVWCLILITTFKIIYVDVPYLMQTVTSYFFARWTEKHMIFSVYQSVILILLFCMVASLFVLWYIIMVTSLSTVYVEQAGCECILQYVFNF